MMATQAAALTPADKTQEARDHHHRCESRAPGLARPHFPFSLFLPSSYLAGAGSVRAGRLGRARARAARAGPAAAC